MIKIPRKKGNAGRGVNKKKSHKRRGIQDVDMVEHLVPKSLKSSFSGKKCLISVGTHLLNRVASSNALETPLMPIMIYLLRKLKRLN